MELNRLCIPREKKQIKKLTQKSVPKQTQKDTIFKNLAIIHVVDTKVVITIRKPRYVSKVHDKNIVITNNILQMSSCIVNI